MIKWNIKAKREDTELSKRSWNLALKSAFKKLGRWWHKNILPRHFEPGAENIYNYAKRTTDYLKKKRKRGIIAPLTFKGWTRKSVNYGWSVRGFPSRAKVTLPSTPKYVSMKRDTRYSKSPQLGEEMQRLSPRDVEEMEAVLQDFVEQGIAENSGRKAGRKSGRSRRKSNALTGHRK